MRLARIIGLVLLSALLLSSVACATPTYHLSTSVNGQGSIMPSSGDFLADRAVSILANAASGWQFDHWEGALSGNDSLVTITMNSDKTITAYFVETGAIPPSEFVTYTDDEYGFSMSVPSSWQTMSMEEAEIEESGTAFFPLSLCSEVPVLGGVVVNETSGLSLQSYYEMVKSDTGDYEDFAILSEEEITINGIPAMKAIFTGSTEGYTVQVMVGVLVKGHSGWDIELGCASECWDTYEDTFNTMLSSFQVLD